MYERLKQIAPTSLIKNNEMLIRKLISIFFIGNNYECNICNFKMSNFIKLSNNDRLCPKCASLPRTRRLWNILEPNILNKTILHFSPSPSMRKKIDLIGCVNYVTSDYVGEFNADKNLNIESIDEPDETYDVIICFHVLEHIENDLKAMKELKRILKPNGLCYIQTPFKEGETYENDEIKTDEERLIHFGQKDHLRIYSVKGLIERLESVGFETVEKVFKSDIRNKHGFKTFETIITAKNI